MEEAYFKRSTRNGHDVDSRVIIYADVNQASKWTDWRRFIKVPNKRQEVGWRGEVKEMWETEGRQGGEHRHRETPGGWLHHLQIGYAHKLSLANATCNTTRSVDTRKISGWTEINQDSQEERFLDLSVLLTCRFPHLHQSSAPSTKNTLETAWSFFSLPPSSSLCTATPALIHSFQANIERMLPRTAVVYYRDRINRPSLHVPTPFVHVLIHPYLMQTLNYKVMYLPICFSATYDFFF